MNPTKPFGAQRAGAFPRPPQYLYRTAQAKPRSMWATFSSWTQQYIIWDKLRFLRASGIAASPGGSLASAQERTRQRMWAAICCAKSWFQVSWFQVIPLLRALIPSRICSVRSPAAPAAPVPWTFAARALFSTRKVVLAVSFAVGFSMTEARCLGGPASQELGAGIELFNGLL